MKRIAIALLACLPVFGVGSVGQSINPLGPQAGTGGLPESRVHVMTITWVGDSVNGTVPSTVISTAAFPQMQGMRLFQIKVQPGSPNPSANYSVTLTDETGVDLLQAQGANLSATASFFNGSLLSPPLLTSPTFALSGNSVASARGTVTLYFAPLSTVAAARGLPATLPANNSFTGSMTIGNIDNVRHIDGSKFAKTAAGINAADTDCGAGTACVIEVEYPGTYSDTSITLSKNHFLRFHSGGTYIHKGIVGPDSSTDTTAVWGVICPEHATLQLAGNSNTDSITDTNFLTLSGSGNTFGTFGFTLQGCTIDGNKTNQTALATRGTGTPSTVARTAGGVVTIVMTGATSPAMAVGDTCNVQGITNDGSSFDGRFIAQTGTTASQLVFNQTARNTIASVAATGAGTAICFSGLNGVRIFGRNYSIEDVSIGNNVLDGLWTEGYSPTFVDLTSRMESTVRRLRLANSGGDGWAHWGPQNSYAYDVIDFNHGQWGREVFEPLRDFGTTGYLNGSGSLHIQGFGAIQQTAGQETSAAGWGILVDSGTQANTFSSELAACAGCIALEVRSVNQTYQGVLNGSSTALKINAGAIQLAANVFGNSGTLVQLTSEAESSALNIQGDTTNNTGCFSVAPSPSDFVSAKTNNGTTCSSFQTPTGNITGGGWTQTIPVGANSTLGALGVAATWTAAQGFNAITSQTGLQIFNTTTTCTTGAAVGSTCTTAAISLPVAEADTSYRVSCTGKGLTNVPVTIATANSSASQFTITVAALTAAAASFASFDCIVGHN